MKQENKLDEEVLASFERDEWRSVDKLDEEKRRFANSAAAALEQGRSVNIRLTARDFADIAALAAAEGLPHESLIASVLHKYATGRLVEAPARDVRRRGKREG
jgi:predicted DNA binding CopG/RHH family protein